MSASWITEIENDEEGRRLLEQERLVVEVTEAMATVMKENGISRSELACRLGKTPAFITKLLRGSNNFTLRTLSDVFYALGYGARVALSPIGIAPTACERDELVPMILDINSWTSCKHTWRQDDRGGSDWPGVNGEDAA